jgi:PAS domain S-box-containing protein
MKSEIVNVDEIQEIIFAYANGDFDKRLAISENRDERDIIISGINMLGEELEKTTISRNYFMSIYNSVSEILIFISLDGKIVDLNLTTEKVLQQSLESLRGKDVKSIISERYLFLENSIRESLKSGEHFFPFEASIIINPEKEIPVSCILSKVIDKSDNHKGYLFIAKDVTEQKNKEINDLKIAISSQEGERKRLANDLHDSLGQEVNAIKLYMNALTLMDKSSEAFIHTFETCKTIVDNSLESIRNISFDLMPRSLEEGSLVEAIEELVKRLQLVCDIEFIYSNQILNLNKENKINIYRIIQEFVNNSMKHATNSRIEIQISVTKNIISLLLKDNGKGFDMDQSKFGKGIYNIKSRINALNAEHNFISELNKGTYLELFIKEVI